VVKLSGNGHARRFGTHEYYEEQQADKGLKSTSPDARKLNVRFFLAFREVEPQALQRFAR